MLRLVLLLIFLIPYQYRFYKVMKGFSRSLVPAGTVFPASFEINFDWFISDFLLLAILIVSLRTVAWRAFVWERERKYLTLFLVIALTSIAASPYESYSLHYWRWFHLALPALALYFVGRVVAENFTLTAKVVLASSLLQCAIAIPQYFIQHSLGLKWLGEQTLTSRHVLGAGFLVPDGSISIFDRLFNVVRNTPYIIRAYGTLPHPNILGGFMLFGLMMTYHLYSLGKRRGWLGFAIFVQVFCLMITYSRSALYIWAAATALWVVLDFWRERKLTTLLYVAVGSFVVCLACFYPQFSERGGVVSYGGFAKESDLLRQDLMNLGVSMVRDQPLLGVGYNNYMLAFVEFAREGSMPLFVHNIYLLLGAEIGIFGLGAFLIFSLMVLKKGWDSRHVPAVRTSLILVFAFLGLGMVDYYPMFNQQARLIFFIAAGVLGIAYSTKTKSSRSLSTV